MSMNFRYFTLIIIASTFLLQSCSETTKDETVIINQIVHKMKDHQTAHFKIDEMYYYSDGIDTTTTNYELWLMRDKNDSSRHGFAWVDNNYRPYNMIFTHDSLYLTIPPKKTTTIYSKFDDNCIAENDWVDFFLNPDALLKQIADTNNHISIKDTTLEGIDCSEIVIRYEIPSDSARGTINKKNTITYIINKQSLTPVLSRMVSERKEHTYYGELRFSNFEFDKEHIADLRAKHKKILEANPIERKMSASENSLLDQMLHIGDSAPIFGGKFYANNQVFNIQDYVGKKIILIDFWYTHCPPCVRAIPAISQLNKDFQEHGLVVFGLNSVDNRKRSLKHLDEFLAKREISYDIIMTQPEVDKAYKIQGYPSMYVIGRDGKIAYVEVGYDKESFAKLKEKVMKLLIVE